MPVKINGEPTDIEVSGDKIREFAFDNIGTIVLKTHLTTEYLLEYFCKSVSGIDLFYKTRSPYAQKLSFSVNLGMPEQQFAVLKKLNSIRNKYAHSLDYAMPEKYIGEMEALCNQVFPESESYRVTDSLSLSFDVTVRIGKKTIREPVNVTYGSADTRVKMLMICCIGIISKLTFYAQGAKLIAGKLNSQSGNRIEILRSTLSTISVE